MKKRLKIHAKWSMIHAGMFLALWVFLPAVFASIIAMTLTVGAFFHESNWADVQAMKRPRLFVRGSHVR